MECEAIHGEGVGAGGTPTERAQWEVDNGNECGGGSAVDRSLVRVVWSHVPHSVTERQRLTARVLFRAQRSVLTLTMVVQDLSICSLARLSTSADIKKRGSARLQHPSELACAFVYMAISIASSSLHSPLEAVHQWAAGVRMSSVRALLSFGMDEMTAFTVVYSANAYSPRSLPIPDCSTHHTTEEEREVSEAQQRWLSRRRCVRPVAVYLLEAAEGYRP